MQNQKIDVGKLAEELAPEKKAVDELKDAAGEGQGSLKKLGEALSGIKKPSKARDYNVMIERKGPSQRRAKKAEKRKAKGSSKAQKSAKGKK